MVRRAVNSKGLDKKVITKLCKRISADHEVQNIVSAGPLCNETLHVLCFLKILCSINVA